MSFRNEPKVGIVTVLFNSERVIGEFLDSLMGNQEGVRLKLYVVDNDSKDRSLELLESYGDRINMHVIRNKENRGVAAGNNQAIKAALADGVDWVLFLNNDTVVPRHTIRDLASVAAANGIDILSPAIKATDPVDTIWYDGGSLYPARGMKVVHDRMGENCSTMQPGLRVTPYASTCCLLVHPVVFGRIGGLDVDYFVYFEDVDFTVRAQAAGYKFWLTGDLTITHKASSLTGGFLGPFTVRWISRNWVLISRKHLPPVRRVIAYGYMQAWMMARLLVGRDHPTHYVRRQRAFFEGLCAPVSFDGTDLAKADLLPKNGSVARILKRDVEKNGR